MLLLQKEWKLGGHIGKLTTMTLVRQVAAAVSIPVIGAGGLRMVKVLRLALCLEQKLFRLELVLSLQKSLMPIKIKGEDFKS